jgi:uncharacterized protein (DUF924 family)
LLLLFLMQADADDILAFWFADACRGPAEASARQAFWFRGSAAVDAAIGARYLPGMEAALRGELAAWSAAPNTALALTLLLDQFPRNVWRGTARAFAGDSLALAAAREAVAAGFLQRLELAQRAFLILPFEHSESLVEQHESMRLFTLLQTSAPDPWRPLFDGYLDYARQHFEIIQQFDRFPHRNRALGREPTAKELAWLEGGGASFGQH